MPTELLPLLILLFLIALGVSAAELRAAYLGPACPQCVHCRHKAAEREAEARAREAEARIEPFRGERDDEPRNRHDSR